MVWNEPLALNRKQFSCEKGKKEKETLFSGFSVHVEGDIFHWHSSELQFICQNSQI